MSLYKDKDIPELYWIKHRHDDDDQFLDYEEKILIDSLSKHNGANEDLWEYIKLMQKGIYLIYDQINVFKNWNNYTVDKYYYKHKN